MQRYDEDVNVEAVGVQTGKGKGPAFGTCWTCGGSHLSKGEQQGSDRFRQRRRQGQGQREADQSDVWVLLDLRRQPLFEGVSERRWQRCKDLAAKTLAMR